MCIPGDHITVRVVPRNKPIRAWRGWRLRRGELKPQYWYGTSAAAVWRTKHARTKPPIVDPKSDSGLHAHARAGAVNWPQPGVVFGRVALYGRVVTHRYHPRGGVVGHRAERATIAYLVYHTKSGKRAFGPIAKAYGVGLRPAPIRW